jgi:hypothetical protein
MSVGKRPIGLDWCGDRSDICLDTGGVPRRSVAIEAERQATTGIGGFGIDIDEIH